MKDKIITIYCLCDDLLKSSIETVFSQITRLFPRSICARTARRFELKIFLFILAFVIGKVC